MTPELRRDLSRFSAHKIATALSDIKQAFDIADLSVAEAMMCSMVTLVRAVVIIVVTHRMRKADFLLEVAEMYDDERDRQEEEGR